MPPRQQQANRRRRARRKQKLASWQRQLASIWTGLKPLLPQMRWQRPRLQLLGRTGFHNSKFASLLLLSIVTGLIYWLHFDDRFYIYRENVRFSGLSYLSDAELYEVCDVEGWNTLWLQPDDIRRRVLQNQYVADAQVQVQLPSLVDVQVREVHPVAIWVTDQGELWLLEDGRALPKRAAISDQLVRIIDAELAATPLGEPRGQAIEVSLLRTALQLADELSGLNSVSYNKIPGLNFQLPNTSYWIYWGDGRDFQAKRHSMEVLQERLQRDGESNQIIDVRQPRFPYIHGL